MNEVVTKMNWVYDVSASSYLFNGVSWISSVLELYTYLRCLNECGIEQQSNLNARKARIF